MSADVIVPVYADVELTRRCLESVLRHSGTALRRLIVVDDASPEPEMAGVLRDLAASDRRVRIIVNERNLGFVESCNRGLGLREGDVVLLNSDTEATPGWLDELLGALREGWAAVSPLSNNATLCSVPAFMRANPAEPPPQKALRGLPRVTELPTLVGFCMAMSDSALSLLGGLDRAFGRGYNEENDWCQRARSRGLRVGRANRVYVMHQGGASFGSQARRLDEYNSRRLVRRYPQYLRENADFERGPMARLAARAVGALKRTLNVTVSLCGTTRPGWLDRELPGVSLTVRRGVAPSDADVHHVIGDGFDLAAVEALLRSDAAVVYSPELRSDDFLLRRERQAMLEASQLVCVPSEASRLSLPEHLPVRVVAPSPRGWGPVEVDVEAKVVHLANHGARDNEPLVVEAFSLVWQSWPAARLVLTAPPTASRVKGPWQRREAYRPGPGSIAIFADVSDTRLDRLVDGIASGALVVALETQGVREVCGEAAVLVDEWSAEALAEATLLLAGDPGLRASLCRRRRALERKTRKLEAQMSDLYRQLLLAPDIASLRRRQLIAAVLKPSGAQELA
ncbi:MAG: glycosyltransferase [Myxococcota bacterium]